MKVYALTEDGKFTYCTADEENRGKGRCNHLLHKEGSESLESFMTRASEIQQKIEIDSIKNNMKDGEFSEESLLYIRNYIKKGKPENVEKEDFDDFCNYYKNFEDSSSKYIEAVIEHKYSLKHAPKDDVKEFQRIISEADGKRVAAHNNLIVNLKVLNKFSEDFMGLPPVYKGNISDDSINRTKIADSLFKYKGKYNEIAS